MIGFSVLLKIIGARVTSAAGALLAGWGFGTGYFIMAQYWTTPAFIELYKSHIWLFPVSLILIPMTLGLLWGVATGAAFFFRRNAAALAISLSVFLTLAEYARAHESVFNFPWNLAGYGLYRLDGLLQFASISGIYGLTFLTFAAAALPYLLSQRRACAQARILFGAIAGGVILIGIWGTMRPPEIQAASTDVQLAIVQPNIPQYKKEEAAFRDENLAALLSLMASIKTDPKQKSLVVFPETMFAVHRDEPPTIYETLGRALPLNGMAAIGIRRFTPQSHGMDVHNSLVFINRAGTVLATYDKHILSPWGEFVPYRNVWEATFLRSILENTTSLERGDGPTTLRLDPFPPINPMICYESAFPLYGLGGPDRPRLHVLPSNDGLSDDTTEPFQSFLNVRVRAIETGVPIARSANSGISAIIDAYGRVMASVPLNQSGVIESALPLPAPPTFYSRYGDRPLLFVLAFLLCGAALPAFMRKSRCS